MDLVKRFYTSKASMVEELSIAQVFLILVFIVTLFIFEETSFPILLLDLNAFIVSRMQRHRLEHLGIELSSLTTIISGIAYVPAMGAIGLTSVLVTSIACSHSDHSSSGKFLE